MKTIKTKSLFLAITIFVSLCFTGLSAQTSKMEFSIPKNDIPISVSKIPQLDSMEIAKSVSYFKINKGSFEGKGADVLKDHITSSKFFVLGENHYSTEISKLTESLVPLLEKSGYKAAAFEVGPLSAEKLKELSNIPDSTEVNLKAFNAKYLNPALEVPPIPMFWYISDAKFLNAFAETKMDIFGIDQEFKLSFLFLGDDLVKSKLSDPNYQDIKAVWETLRTTIEKAYENPEGKILTQILKSPDYKQFENMFDADDQHAQNVLQKLHETCFIYERSDWSHRDRVNYIRSNFLEKYKAIEKENQDARYFIKIGSRHAAKTNYSFGWYDIGSLTQELAEIEQVKSTNVTIPRGTYEGEDFKEDNSPTLISFHKKDSWTIIDLKRLRDDLNSKKFQIITHSDYQALNRMIQGFDLMLIPPADYKPKENW